MVADDNEIYVAKIVKENSNDISKNNELLKVYKNVSSTEIKKKLYSSYDIFLNTKYNIKINEKTLERVKNYFK